MDSLFSRYRFSGTRLAKLMITPPNRHASMILSWYPTNDNSRQKRYGDYYNKTRTAVRRFHLRDSSEADLRAAAESWRLQAADLPKHHALAHNARAVDDYLDTYHDRELVVLVQRKLEACMGGLRVTTRPHLCVLDGPQLCWIWLDCSDVLDEEHAQAKAHVTLLIASRMGLSKTGKVEIVHAASKRIVCRMALPAGFDDAAVGTCERIHTMWTAFDQQGFLSPADRGRPG